MEPLDQLGVVLSSPATAVGAVSFVLASAGFFVLFQVHRKPDSPLNQYLIQILGLCFILPVLLLVSVMINMKAEAITGLLGTLIGYIFGTSAPSRADNRRGNDDTEK